MRFAVLFALQGCVIPRTWTPEGPPHAVGAPLAPVVGAPRNVVLVIGDGMGLSQVSAGRLANGGALNLDRFPVTGLVDTTSASGAITDSAAGATAYATGVRTHNGLVGVDATGEPVETLVEWAAGRGMATGLVATSRITHATPASFAAHVPDRGAEEAIATQMAEAPVDLMIGGGRDRFAPESRSDGTDLLAVLQASGRAVVTGLDDARSASLPLVALLDEKALAGAPRRGPVLADAAALAVEKLASDPDGFFLMVEGSQIDWAGHVNHVPWLVEEVLDLDRALAPILAFAEARGDTLVLVTADHETGGLALKHAEAGERVTGRFVTHHHTAPMVPLYAYGPGAEAFSGTYANTGVHARILSALAAPEQSMQERME